MPPYVKKGPSEAVLRAHELDAAPLESLSPEEQRKRADRERKRTERKAAKEVEAKKEAAERAEKACATREQWWETQRAKLPPKERMEMETLHAQMMEYTSIMREYNQGIAGTDERPQDLEDTKNEVRELHSKYSTTTIVLPQLFWRDKGLFDAIAARATPDNRYGQNCLAYFQYGYLQGLEGFAYQEFEQRFLRPKKAPAEPTTGVIVCEDCGYQSIVPLEVVGWYTKPRPNGKMYKYECPLCKVTNATMPERKALSTEEIHEKIVRHQENKRGEEANDERFSPFDKYGRIRTD